MELRPTYLTILSFALFTAPAISQSPLWRVDGPTPNSRYGFSLSTAGDVDGDGVGDVVVGAQGIGVVEVLSGLDGSTILSVPGYAGSFGHSVDGGVDMDNDGVPDIAVGSPYDYTGGPAVTVVSSATGSTIFEVQGTGCMYYPGEVVEMLGDMTGDGIPEIAISSGDEGGDFPGVTTVLYEDPLAPGSTIEMQTFGDACNCWCDTTTGVELACVGDIDGNGFDDFALTKDFSSGALRVYGGPNLNLLYQVPLSLPNPSSPGSPTKHVAGIGDINQDGRSDVAVIARITFSLYRLRVYTGKGNLAYQFDTLAENVVGVGDANADGYDDFLLGYPEDNTVGLEAGAAFLHSGVDGSLLATFYGESAGDRFGSVLAPIGDASGDGVGDFVIGTWHSGNGYVAAFESPGSPPQPFTYCTAKVTSTGCVPLMDWSGTPSLSGPDDFLALARNALPTKPGLFFWGSTGTVAVPFLGGTLCVQPGLTRTSIQNAPGQVGCEGGFAFHFSQSYMSAEGVAAGDTINGQFWSRDPDHPDGTGVGLTNAIEFTIWP